MISATPANADFSSDADFEDAQAQEEGVLELFLEPADCGQRLDKVLARHLPSYSRSRIQQWLEADLISVDGHGARARTTVLGDERVLVRPQADPETLAFQPEAMDLPIVHADAHIVVIDKPAGMVVHPGAGNWSGTLLNGLLHHFPALAKVPRAGIVHRLDKDTSGLMVVAMSLEAQTALVRQLQARTVRREYLALVWGSPPARGKIEGAIGRHPRDRVRMAVLELGRAKPALTHYEKLAESRLDGRAVSLVRCQLETGRTHQIRVHMQSLGFPLVGDALYGKQHLAQVFPRQALHAWKLGLIHPGNGSECAWRSDLPADFAALLDAAGMARPV